MHLRFTELPSEFDGTFPVVIALDETELARATEPVSSAGAVSIALPPDAGSLADISARLGTFDLVVPER